MPNLRELCWATETFFELREPEHITHTPCQGSSVDLDMQHFLGRCHVQGVRCVSVVVLHMQGRAHTSSAGTQAALREGDGTSEGGRSGILWKEEVAPQRRRPDNQKPRKYYQCR